MTTGPKPSCETITSRRSRLAPSNSALDLCSPASPRVSLLITSQFSSPGTPTKVHLPQQACSKGGAAFPRQLTSPHEYPHLCQNSGSNRFPQGFPFGGAHNAFLHAKPLAHGFPSPGGFPFLFFTFPNFSAEHYFPHLAMLPQGCPRILLPIYCSSSIIILPCHRRHSPRRHRHRRKIQPPPAVIVWERTSRSQSVSRNRKVILTPAVSSCLSENVNHCFNLIIIGPFVSHFICL